MKNYLLVLVLIACFMLAGWYAILKNQSVVAEPVVDVFPQSYEDSTGGFSLHMPLGYVPDSSYTTQQSPSLIISGVKFTIPAATAAGTNLSRDSFISVEHIQNAPACSADMFFDGTHETLEVMEQGVTYSVATSSGAGAGNRYEETVYAFPGTSPCIGVRYMVHSSAIQNYDPGTVREFDRAALIAEFDAIRRTLKLNR
jgi:hypothetical protein